MTSTLFQNILPEDIPVMLKRLNAYTKSYQKEEYIKHAGDPADFIGIIESGSVHILQDDYYGNRNITASIPQIPVWEALPVCNSISSRGYCGSRRGLYSDVPKWEKLLNTCDNSCTFHHTLIRNLLGIVAQKNVSESEDQIYLRKTTREKLMAYLTDQAKLKRTTILPSLSAGRSWRIISG